MLELAIEIMIVIPYIGVVFSCMGSLSLDRYNFHFMMIVKETLTFLPISNLALQCYVLPTRPQLPNSYNVS